MSFEKLDQYTMSQGKSKAVIKKITSKITISGVPMTIITYKPAMHMPDDYLYNKFPELQAILPRGCSFIIIPSDDGTNHIIRAFGIRKFGGYKPTDDDDVQDIILSEKNSKYVDNSIITLDGRSLSDVSSIVYTEKSNGENMKCGLFTHNSQIYLWAGSKMTVNIWTSDEPFNACGLTKDNHAEYPGETICTIWSKFYLQLSETNRTYLNDLFISEQIISFIGEINRPWAEHIIPISHTFVEFFTILDNDGISIVPKRAFEIFKQIGLTVKDESDIKEYGFYHVPFTVFDCPCDELNLTVKNISNEIINTSNHPNVRTEGGVLYLCDKESNIVSLVKVKNDWYTFWRRVREQCKNKKTTFSSIKQAIRKLNFTDSYETNVEIWCIWAEYFFNHFSSLPEEEQENILKCTYASYVSKFVSDNFDNIKIPAKEELDVMIHNLEQDKIQLRQELTQLFAIKKASTDTLNTETDVKIASFLNCVKNIDNKIKDFRQIMFKS